MADELPATAEILLKSDASKQFLDLRPQRPFRGVFTAAKYGLELKLQLQAAGHAFAFPGVALNAEINRQRQGRDW